MRKLENAQRLLHKHNEIAATANAKFEKIDSNTREAPPPRTSAVPGVWFMEMHSLAREIVADLSDEERGQCPGLIAYADIHPRDISGVGTPPKSLREETIYLVKRWQASSG